MNATNIQWTWRGRIAYGEALEQQRAHRAQVIEGSEPEVLWLLEHPPVITVGRRPAPDTPTAADCRQMGLDYYQVERGGLATYHGPGQLIVYAIVQAAQRGLGVRGMVHAMESSIIDWLAHLDIPANRHPQHPGVWVGNEKICALGLHFRRGVSMHGLALNLSPDLTGFNHIVPCGIADAGVTSVQKLIGQAPSLESAAPDIAEALVTAIER